MSGWGSEGLVVGLGFVGFGVGDAGRGVVLRAGLGVWGYDYRGCAQGVGVCIFSRLELSPNPTWAQVWGE